MTNDTVLALSQACHAEVPLDSALSQLTSVLASALQASRVSIWQRNEQSCLFCRAESAADNPLRRAAVFSAQQCPRYFQQLQTRQLLISSDPQQDPRLAELAAGYLAPFAISALLEMPVHAGGQLWGVLRVEQNNGRREWSAADQSLLILAGELLEQRLQHEQLQTQLGKLQQINAMQQAILDGADYAIISTDVDGVIRSFNAAATRMLGYPAEAVIGKLTPALFHDADEVLQRATELSQQLGEPINSGFDVFVALSRRGQAEQRQWTYIRSDGSRFPVLLSVTPIREHGDGISGFLGIAADLSEQQKTRASLRDSEARYHTLFEGTGDSIFLMRGEQFVDCNPATLKMFGCTREQIIGQPPYRFSPEFQPDGRRSDEKAVEKITAAFNGMTQKFDWLHCQYDGTPFDAEVTLNIVTIAGEPHLLATVRDQSERKRADAELAQSRKELLERNESLRLINQLSTQLHGSADTQLILQMATDALLGLSQSPHVMICLQDDDPMAPHVNVSAGFAAERFPVGELTPLVEALDRVLAKQPGLFVCPALTDGEPFPTAVRDRLQHAGVQAGVVIPLPYREKVLGRIGLWYREPRDFGDIELDSFTAIGNTVALAIASARHVDGLEYLAHHDSLTGLPNRMFLHREFAARMAHRKTDNGRAALMLMDLDRFKEINDTLGHHVGDLLLQQIGPRLKSAFAGQDGVLCRLGGDEFTLLLPDGITAAAENGEGHIEASVENDVEAMRQFAQQLLKALRAPYDVAAMQLMVDASIGIAFYPDDGDDSHALLRSADVAMYEAKRKGGGVAIYDRSQDQNSPERLAMMADLDLALRERQLLLHYQPKLELKSGRITGFEALVRWQHPRFGLLFPDSFLPMAEMSEAIHPLTELVLDMALAQLQQWQTRGLKLNMAVNLSARNLRDDRILQTIQTGLQRYQVEPAQLELEITETALMDEPEQAAFRLDRMAELGVRIAIDDYGAGYSSLGYLHRLPIHALKIDRLFVRDMFSNEHDTIIVRSTIALAHNLGLQVVAEGVEDSQTQMLLLGMGCDHIQGYHLSRPMPPDQLGRFLQNP
ncbi:EAL domain-containing protein [Permianibacter sp. IMCC34836]|uniref:bifunctional diguanylate cyclase/phosphodiesterase n=1 Tax=Permianibacter fluminis TaxID=2738515 RepID=UPI001552F91D|nr:EAL domain-containing protein [Permianibacter fluminis]NQD36792.1 EAL domain-containing protein [Permianibacter fluminis]